MDDVSNAMGAGAGIVIISPEGVKLEHSMRLGFRPSNNEAEYKALLAGLRAALSLEAVDLEVYYDSRLVVSQVKGSFEAKDAQMTEYLKLIKQIISRFQKVKIV